MAEYIEKQAAKDAIKIEWDGVAGQYEAWAIIKDTCDAIDEVPPADVRPVVLCKDCDLWNEWDSSGKESLGTYRCSCAEWTTEIATYYTGPDEFCSRGVRRDSDG